MKVKIIKCSYEHYWYKNNIGEIYSVEDIDYPNKISDIYYSNRKNWILKKDCLILDRLDKLNRIL